MNLIVLRIGRGVQQSYGKSRATIRKPVTDSVFMAPEYLIESDCAMFRISALACIALR
jgi:hypothetical protein